MPTRMQLHYKIQHCKKMVAKTQKIANTGDLEAISKQFDIPVDLTDCFVAYHEVIDDQGPDNVRFIVIWTSQKMQARVNDELLQDNATYCLNWLRFPLFISGRSHVTTIPPPFYYPSSCWGSPYPRF